MKRRIGIFTLVVCLCMSSISLTALAKELSHVHTTVIHTEEVDHWTEYHYVATDEYLNGVPIKKRCLITHHIYRDTAYCSDPKCTYQSSRDYEGPESHSVEHN